MAIRYNNQLNNTITRIVKNYNAKITRLEKSSKEYIIPEKTSLTDIKKSVSSRSQLNRILKELQKFNERGMEETIKLSSGLEMSKYSVYKAKKNIRVAKSKLTRELKDFQSRPIKVFGVEQVTPHEYDEAYLNLKAKKDLLDEVNFNELTKNKLNRLISSTEDIIYSNERESMYKENWLDMLDKLAYYGKIDEKKKEEIKERLNNMSASNFTKMYRNEKSIKYIQELYGEIVRNKGNIDDSLFNDISENINNFYRNLDKIVEDYV